MFTLKVQKDAKTAKNYFEEHLSSNENTAGYYVGGKDISVGSWVGSAGQKMGLPPGAIVTKEDFKSLISNSFPDGSRQITPRQKDNRRLYFDATVSAPKSLSILALVANDERLIRAHQEANAEALALAETLAQTRVRVNGKNELRKTGNILAAQFTHTTSRSNDPQLHTHNVILNFTWDDVEKKYKALEGSQLYNQATFVTEVYRNALAKKVLELGYEVEADVHGFKIKGVSQEICDLYSKRSSAIKAAVLEKEKEAGRPLSNNEKSHIAHKSRKKKNKDLTYSEVKEVFLSQISSHQLSEMQSLVDSSKRKSLVLQEKKEKELYHAGDLVEKRDLLNEQIAVNKGLMHLFERSSVVTFPDVLKASLQSNLGKLDLSKLKSVLNSRNDIFIKDDLVVSKEELAREWFCVNFVDSKVDQVKPVFEKIDEGFITSLKDHNLRDDQLSSLCGLLTNKDGVLSLRGSAGAGKSHTISLLIQELKKQKIEVLPLAPTSGAAENLRADFSLDTMTLQGFLKSPLKGRSPKFLIVDEAGLCSLKQMKDLFVKANDLGARVLLVGDTKQNLSVESGDSLRVLEKFSKLKTFELKKIERQKDLTYRHAVQSIVDLNVEESFKTFSSMRAIKEHDEIEGEFNPLFDEVAKEYISDVVNNKKSLIVGFSWNDITELNRSVRDQLFEENILSLKSSLRCTVYEDLSLTASERLNTDTYFKHANEVFVILRKEVNGLKKNTPYRIDSTSNKSFFIDKGDGSLTELSVGFNKDSVLSPVDFNVLTKNNISVSPGEKLLLQANYRPENGDKRKSKFLNGEVVTVNSVSSDEIFLKDGRVIPKEYNLFTYGYAVTSVASQGKTADKVIVAASTSSGRAVSYNSFYVAVSRGKNEVSIHVNDLDRVKSVLNSVASRESALEFIRKNAKDLNPEEQQKWLELKNKSGRVFGQKIHENFLMEQLKIQDSIDQKVGFAESKDRFQSKRNLLYKENMSFALAHNETNIDKNKSAFIDISD